MKPLLTGLLLLLIFSAPAQKIIDSRVQEIVFRSVNVIPMDEERVISNQVVVIKNGIITAIGDPAKVKYGRQSTVIDATGKYLMPGLGEMHAHVPPIDDIEPMKEVLLLFAVNGVTTIRGMLGHPRHLELREKLRSGEILGPGFITSGPSFSGSSVKSVDQAIAMVRSQKTAGYDFLKLHPGLSKEIFSALVKTAREVNIPFGGHVSFDVGIWRAIEARYATIDHLDGFMEGIVPGIDSIKEKETGLFGLYLDTLADTTLIPKLMKELHDNNISVVPTQALAERWFAPDMLPEKALKEPEMIYMKSDILKNWADTKANLMHNKNYSAARVSKYIDIRRKLIFECNKNGVQLLLGSDAPQIFNVPGFSIHHELRYLVNAGLTPYEALRTGTVNVASFLNRAGELGTLTVGAVSNIILLGGNPLADIRQTSNIEGVMLGSKWLPKAYIKNELKKLVKQPAK
ncbi:MAG: amidohydrolase family protein [Chitinophagaceae bacterium]